MDQMDDEDVQIAATAIIREYGDVLVKVSEDDKQYYPTCFYPQSLLPIRKDILAKILEIEIGDTEDAQEKENLKVALVLLDGFIDDGEANKLNSEMLELQQIHGLTP